MSQSAGQLVDLDAVHQQVTVLEGVNHTATPQPTPLINYNDANGLRQIGH